MNWLRRFLADEEGVTAVEYAVMLALLITVCIVVIGTIGTNTSELMDPGGSLSGALHSGS
jgi:pilus assembly protein Flp/PilA